MAVVADCPDVLDGADVGGVGHAEAGPVEYSKACSSSGGPGGAGLEPSWEPS